MTQVNVIYLAATKEFDAGTVHVSADKKIRYYQAVHSRYDPYRCDIVTYHPNGDAWGASPSSCIWMVPGTMWFDWDIAQALPAGTWT